MTVDRDKALVIFPDLKDADRWQNELYDIGFRTVYFAQSANQALAFLQNFGADESAVVVADGKLLGQREFYAEEVLAFIYDMPQVLFLLVPESSHIQSYSVQIPAVKHRQKLSTILPVAN